MAVVDVHQHLWPPSFVDALSRRTAPPYLDGDTLQLAEGTYPAELRRHDLDVRLALLDRSGIDVAVVSLQPTLGLQLLGASERNELEQAWEEGALEVAAAAGGRVLPLSPRLPRPGFAGASVGADALGDLDAAASVLDALHASGGFLFVHPVAGSPPAQVPSWWPAVVDYTGQMQRAYFAWLAGGLERWPGVNVVFTILAGGGPFQLERLGCRGGDPAALSHRNLYFDTASYGPRALRLCVEAIGAEQLVFGSDAPVVDPSHAWDALAPLGDDVGRLVREASPGRILA
jgi:6-methylsalicylate decarboxylase